MITKITKTYVVDDDSMTLEQFMEVLADTLPDYFAPLLCSDLTEAIMDECERRLKRERREEDSE